MFTWIIIQTVLFNKVITSIIMLIKCTIGIIIVYLDWNLVDINLQKTSINVLHELNKTHESGTVGGTTTNENRQYMNELFVSLECVSKYVLSKFVLKIHIFWRFGLFLSWILGWIETKDDIIKSARKYSRHCMWCHGCSYLTMKRKHS